jgi:hypothetical protein
MKGAYETATRIMAWLGVDADEFMDAFTGVANQVRRWEDPSIVQSPIFSTTLMEWFPYLQVLIIVEILLMVFSKAGTTFYLPGTY